MSFDRERLPDPVSYFEGQGLRLVGPRSSKWKTTACNFHGGSDSMRINAATGAWCCMNCGEKGGDVVAYEMQAYSLEFVEAAKRLGCWIDDGKVPVQQKPTALPARAALQLIALEANLAAIAAANVAHGIELTHEDLQRLLVASRRIATVAQEFA